MAGSVRTSQESRAQTPAMPEDPNLASIPEGNDRGRAAPRRGSFSFLKRGKSVERVGSTRSSSGKLSKKQSVAMREQEAQRSASISNKPPKIPDIAPPPVLQTFGGEDARPDSVAIMSNRTGGATGGGFQNPRAAPRTPGQVGGSYGPHNVPIPPIPSTVSRGVPQFDPYARTESMTHRGRYSYASSAVSTINSPRRVRRRKDPTPFNILVVGARNSGKTSFIEFLRRALTTAKDSKQRTQSRDRNSEMPPATSASPSFKSHYLETEIEGERIGLTLWDSEGLDKNIVDLQLRDMSYFLESKFEETFNEEMKVIRSPGVQDTHIHCVFLVLDPLRLDASMANARKSRDANGASTTGRSFVPTSNSTKHLGILEEDFDLQVLRTLQGKTTVVPIISKADTVTTAHMVQLKRAVWDSLRKADLDPLEALGLDDEGAAVEGDEDSSSTEGEAEEIIKIPSARMVHELDGNSTVPPRDRPILQDRPSDQSQTSHLNLSSSDDEAVQTPPKKQQQLHAQSPSQQQKQSPGPTRPSHHSRNSSATLPPKPILNNPSGKKSTFKSSNHSATPSSSEEIPLPYLPLSILSPDTYTPNITGRAFPWGFADPYNSHHCDFGRLKDAVFKEWRGELREASRDLWYEGWRTERLNLQNQTGGRMSGLGGRGSGMGSARGLANTGNGMATRGMGERGMSAHNSMNSNMRTVSGSGMGTTMGPRPGQGMKGSPGPGMKGDYVAPRPGNINNVGMAR